MALRSSNGGTVNGPSIASRTTTLPANAKASQIVSRGSLQIADGEPKHIDYRTDLVRLSEHEGMGSAPI